MEAERDIYGNYYLPSDKFPDGCGFVLMIIGVIAVLTFFFGCASHKSVSHVERDSVRVEVRHKTVFVPDTILVPIPAQSSSHVTIDSLSNLENDFATSTARINPDGSLYHDLKTKPQEKPVEIQKPVVYRDSIVYVDKLVEDTKIEYVEKKLTKWQRLCMSLGTGVLIAPFLLFAIWLVYRKLRK